MIGPLARFARHAGHGTVRRLVVPDCRRDGLLLGGGQFGRDWRLGRIGRAAGREAAFDGGRGEADRQQCPGLQYFANQSATMRRVPQHALWRSAGARFASGDRFPKGRQRRIIRPPRLSPPQGRRVQTAIFVIPRRAVNCIYTVRG